MGNVHAAGMQGGWKVRGLLLPWMAEDGPCTLCRNAGDRKLHACSDVGIEGAEQSNVAYLAVYHVDGNVSCTCVATLWNFHGRTTSTSIDMMYALRLHRCFQWLTELRTDHCPPHNHGGAKHQSRVRFSNAAFYAVGVPPLACSTTGS